MKKMMSLFLAMAMAFALAIPAFAQQQNDPSTQNIAVAGKMAAPTIQIEAPSDVTLTLNPYQMKYNGDIKLLKDSTDQILSLPAVFVNKTDGKLNAALVATATVPSTVELKDSTVVEATAKQVFLQMQFGMMTDKNGAWENNTEPAKGTIKATESGAGKPGKLEYKKNGDITTAGQGPLLSIPETDGKTANYFGFKFCGDMAKSLATGTWTSSDAISVAVVLTLSPVNSTVS